MKDVRRKLNRGVTIAEMCVVIAVVAIIATVVASFSALMAKRVDNNSLSLAFYRDKAVVETMTERWIDELALAGEYTFSFRNGDLWAQNTENSEDIKLFHFSYGKLKVQWMDGEEFEYELENVRNLECKIIENNGKDNLFVFTLAYLAREDGDLQIARFTVYPYIGIGG